MGYRDNELLLLELMEMEEIWKGDCWRWLCDQVFTLDEASQSVRPWPREKKFLREVLAVLNGEQVVLIPKSRQMMISWLVAAFFTHHARFFENSALFWQSEEERKSAFAVDQRCLFIEENLKFPETRLVPKTTRTKVGMVGRMVYPNKSYIWAIPQGGKVLRAYTATKIMIDESEFQQQAAEAWRAAMPLVQKGSQLIVVSSSDGPNGLLAELCATIKFFSWRDFARLAKAA